MTRLRQVQSAAAALLGRDTDRCLREVAAIHSPSRWFSSRRMGPPCHSNRDYCGIGGKVKDHQMLFDRKTRDACWRKAALLLSRDPERWWQDAAGNAVIHFLWGFKGLYGYMFDHIVPVSRGGEYTLDNCQILQAVVYLSKPEEGWMDPAKEMRDNSPCLKLGDKELDFAELVIYGNASRPQKQSHIWTVDKKIGLVKPMDGVPAGKPDEASKHI